MSLAPYHTSRRTSAVFATFTHVFNNKYCFRIRRQTPVAFVSGRAFVVVINNDIAFSLSLGSVFFFFDWRRILFKRKTSAYRSPRLVSIIFINTLYIFFFSRPSGSSSPDTEKTLQTPPATKLPKTYRPSSTRFLVRRAFNRFFTQQQ